MTLSIASIKQLIATEYSAATAEVHAAIAWIEGKDAEVAAANSRAETAINQLREAAPILQKAGYQVTLGAITPPAA